MRLWIKLVLGLAAVALMVWLVVRVGGWTLRFVTNSADSGEAGPGSIATTVEIAELMGAEISLHVECQGNRLVIRTEPTFKGREGDPAVLTFKSEKIHLFDKETEQAIAH